MPSINRKLEDRLDKRPILRDLKDSGHLEEVSDIVLFIYRDEVYFEESRDKGTAELIIAKNRGGPTGKVRLIFLGQYQKFSDFIPTPMY